MSKTSDAKDWLMADRVAIYILRLKSGGTLSVHSLVAEFGVNRRTVYRDLACVERHVPVYSVVPGGSSFKELKL